MTKEGIRALVVCKHPSDSKKAIDCQIINKDGFNIAYLWKDNLTKNELKDIDLVIAIGGDGTVLSASHYLLDKPFLAVNSAPGKSEGALTTINIEELSAKLDDIKKGKFSTEKLERIQIEINGKLQEPIALNEVFIANEKAYLISKYKIKFREKDEEQKSSGIIFSTGAGSTAWFHSAGGEPFDKGTKYIKMIVREPYFGKLGKFSFLKATIKESEMVEVIPKTDSVIAIDSIREIKIKEGDVVKIKISEHPLVRIR